MSPVAVVGVVGGEVFGPAARAARQDADVVVGAPRHLAGLPARSGQELVELTGPLPPLIDEIAARRERGQAVCVLASGDPGFFGIARLLGARFGPGDLAVHPAPSSVSLAFAAAGLTWDDAVVVSAHGRDPTAAVDAARHHGKVAILTSPATPPQAIGAALVDGGCAPRSVLVASRLGEADERIECTNLAGLAAGTYDPMSVVILIARSDPADSTVAAEGPTIAWGTHETRFVHRAGMITKAEVRAVALSKLALVRTGVLWDVGAGSGSVAVEAASMAPGLRVIAIDRDEESAPRIAENASTFGVDVEIVIGAAPGILNDLADPDRIFVGGGGPAVVEACWARLRPRGRIVATSIVLEHALAARELLGEMVQLHVDRCVPIGTSGVRFEPLNPVFIAWGER
jgi:precorrin-6Y C5,15-methyltransferase (decarboxylating)